MPIHPREYRLEMFLGKADKGDGRVGEVDGWGGWRCGVVGRQKGGRKKSRHALLEV